MASNNARLKITFNSPTVIGFTFLCFLAMVLNILTDGETNRTIFITYHSSLKDPMTYLRLVTYVLGHANWSHFLGNISYILLLGPTLEDRYGSRNVMLTILVTAIVTGLINYIFKKMFYIHSHKSIFINVFISCQFFTAFFQCY